MTIEKNVARIPSDEYIHEFWCASNMSHNYELFGAQACQNKTSLLFLSRLLEDVRPKSIVEIGTYSGGLTALFGFYAALHDAHVLTFDIENKISPQTELVLDSLGVLTVQADCFLDTSQALIKAAIARGKTFVFCDGGDKIKEFNHFAGLIKPGDFIFCHDYGRDPDTFAENVYLKSWGWAEVFLDDIRNACSDNNLSLVESDLCQKAALGVFKKRSKDE